MANSWLRVKKPWNSGKLSYFEAERFENTDDSRGRSDLKPQPLWEKSGFVPRGTFPGLG
jgi:hypothetical protein